MVTQTQIGSRDRTRNQPISNDLEAVLSYAEAQTGLEARVWSGGQASRGTSTHRTGSTRHDNGNAADLDVYVNGRRLSERNENDRALLQRFVAAAVAAGATGIGGGPAYMGDGRLHIGFNRSELGVYSGEPLVYRGPQWLKDAVYQMAPQQQLALMRDLGYANTNPADAIRQFQADRGLTQDGIIGPQTRQALLQAVGTLRSSTNTGPNRPSMPSAEGAAPGTLGPVGQAISNVAGSIWSQLTGQPQPLGGVPAPEVPIPPKRPLPPTPSRPLPSYDQGLAARPGPPRSATNVTNSQGAASNPFVPLPAARPSGAPAGGANVLPAGLWASGAPMPKPKATAPAPGAAMPAPDFGLGGSRTAHGVSAAAPLPQPRTSGFSLPSPSFGTGSMTGTPINVKVAEPLFKHIPASTKIIPAAASTGSALASAAGAVGSALAKGASSAFGAFNGVFNSPLAKAGWPTTQPAQTVTIPARRVAIAPPVATPKSPWNGQFLSAPPTGATNANTYYDATTGKWQGYQPSAVASNGFRSGSNWSGYSSPPPAGASNSNTYYDRTTGTWGAY